tara:strand:+ start:139 stop:1101 length:963 start_codon:yes stop_codon:yes gene_type:complete
MPRLDVDRFLEDLTGRPSRLYAAAVKDMFAGIVTRNKPAIVDARDAMADLITETMGVAEVLGASIALQKAAAVHKQIGDTMEADRARMVAFADEPTQTLLPRVTLAEALEDMVERTPVTLRRAADRTAQRISQLYSEGRVIAFARSAEAAVTHEAQRFVARALREGIPSGEAGKALAMSVDKVRVRSAAWSEGYARMAFRTNVNTAVTAGRFRQAQDPDIKAVIPAFRFDAVGDSDTRDNHGAADGMILKVDNKAWNRLAPPLGYQCRCQVSLVSVPQLRRMGRIDQQGNVSESRVPRGAFPDPGFRHGGRPDLLIVGGV